MSLAAKTATTSASSSTVKPDDKIAQDRFMQYQKQAKLKAEQVNTIENVKHSNLIFRLFLGKIVQRTRSQKTRR